MPRITKKINYVEIQLSKYLKIGLLMNLQEIQRTKGDVNIYHKTRI